MMSQDFEATDVGDFFDDSEYSQKASRIGYTDNIMGSQSPTAGQSKSHDPGISEALEVHPDIYQGEVEVMNAAVRAARAPPSAQAEGAARAHASLPRGGAGGWRRL